MPVATSLRRSLTITDWKLLLGVAAAQVVAAAAVRLMPASVLGRKAARPARSCNWPCEVLRIG
jgi:hypothetical protein